MKKRKTLLAAVLAASVIASQSANAAVVYETGSDISITTNDVLIINKSIHTSDNWNSLTMSDITSISNQSPVISDGSTVTTNDGKTIKKIAQVDSEDLGRLSDIVDNMTGGKTSTVISKEEFWNLVKKHNQEAYEKYEQERQAAKEAIKQEANSGDAKAIRDAIISMLNGINPFTGEKYDTDSSDDFQKHQTETTPSLDTEGSGSINESQNESQNETHEPETLGPVPETDKLEPETLPDDNESENNGGNQTSGGNNDAISGYHSLLDDHASFEDYVRTNIQESIENMAQEGKWSNIPFIGNAKEIEGDDYQEDEWADELYMANEASILGAMKVCHICGKTYGFYKTCDCGKMFDGSAVEAYLQNEKRANDLNKGKNLATHNTEKERSNYSHHSKAAAVLNEKWNNSESAELSEAYNQLITDDQKNGTNEFQKAEDALAGLDEDDVKEIAGIIIAHPKTDTNNDSLTDYGQVYSYLKEKGIAREELSTTALREIKAYCDAVYEQAKKESDLAIISWATGNTKTKQIEEKNNSANQYIAQNDAEKAAYQADDYGVYQWSQISDEETKKEAAQQLINNALSNNVIESAPDVNDVVKAMDKMAYASYTPSTAAVEKVLSDSSSSSNQSKEQKVANSLSTRDYIMIAGMIADGKSSGDLSEIAVEHCKNEGYSTDEISVSDVEDAMYETAKKISETAGFNALYEKTANSVRGKYAKRIVTSDQGTLSSPITGRASDDNAYIYLYENGDNTYKKRLDSSQLEDTQKAQSALRDARGTNTVYTGSYGQQICQFCGKPILDTNPDQIMISATNGKMGHISCSKANEIADSYQRSGLSSSSDQTINDPVKYPDDEYDAETAKEEIGILYGVSSEEAEKIYNDDYNGSFTLKDKIAYANSSKLLSRDTAIDLLSKYYNEDKAQAEKRLDNDYDGKLFLNENITSSPYYDPENPESALKVMDAELKNARDEADSLKMDSYTENGKKVDSDLSSIESEIRDKMENPFVSYDYTDQEAVKEAALSGDAAGDAYSALFDTYYVDLTSVQDQLTQDGTLELPEYSQVPISLTDKDPLLETEALETETSPEEYNHMPESSSQTQAPEHPSEYTNDNPGNEAMSETSTGGWTQSEKESIKDYVNNHSVLDETIPGAESLTETNAAEDYKNSDEFKNTQDKINGGGGSTQGTSVTNKTTWTGVTGDIVSEMTNKFNDTYGKTWNDMVDKGIFDNTPFGQNGKTGTSKTPKQVIDAINDYIAGFTAVNDSMNVTVTVDDEVLETVDSDTPYQVRAGTQVDITGPSGENIFSRYFGGSSPSVNFTPSEDGIYKCQKSAIVYDVTYSQHYERRKKTVSLAAEDGTTVVLNGYEYYVFREDQNGLTINNSTLYAGSTYSIHVTKAKSNFDFSGWFDTQRMY